MIPFILSAPHFVNDVCASPRSVPRTVQFDCSVILFNDDDDDNLLAYINTVTVDLTVYFLRLY